MDPALTSVRPQGACLLGVGGGPSHMWICLLYLFMSVSVLFCLFFAWLKSFLSLEIQALTQMPYAELGPRVRNLEASIISFWYRIDTNKTFPLCLPRSGTLTVFSLMLCGIQEC